jgi:alpha-D-xyloside xylohydrolase
MTTPITYVQKTLDLRLNKTLINRVADILSCEAIPAGILATCSLTETLSDEAARNLDDLNDQQSYLRKGDTTEIEKELLTVRFRFVTEEVVRVTVTPQSDATVYNHHQYVAEPAAEVAVHYEEDDEQFSATTAQLKLVIFKKQNRYAISRLNGETLFEENNSEKSVYFGYISTPLGYSRVDDEVYIGQSFKMTVDEDFYGFGEQFTYFNKKGTVTDIWNVDPANTLSLLSYKNVPFFLSTRGYGFLLHSSRRSLFDMGSKTTAAWNVKVQGKELDYYLLFGATPQNVLQQYYTLTGRPALPPQWSFGLWMSKLGTYNTQEAVLHAAHEFRRRGMPVDVLHVDPPWLLDNNTLVCTYQWGEAFPDPQTMLQELERLHFKLSLWICPFIPMDCELYDEGIVHGYFVKDKDGNTLVNQGPMNWWSKPFVYIDFTNPETVSWFKAKLTSLLRLGPIVLKTDLGELGAYEALYHNGMDGAEGHNFYTLAYQKVVFEATQEVHGEESMIWCRSGYIGSQLYPVHWAGDVKCDYENMAGQLRALLGAGMSGFPFFSHDIGGFVGDPTSDLFMRWFQFGMFSSHARIHGSARREPWDYGEEIATLCESYLKLRYSLLPHIYSAAVESCGSGEPICKALVLEYSDDPTVRTLDNQYLFCNDFLVAPMFQAEGARKIYLPAGTWIDYWDQEVFEGSRWITRYYPLERLPLFVKAGSIILRTEPSESIAAQALWDHLRIEIYPGHAGQKVVHQQMNHTGSISVEEKDGVLFITTENIIGTPTVRLMGEHTVCFLDGKRFSL